MILSAYKKWCMKKGGEGGKHSHSPFNTTTIIELSFYSQYHFSKKYLFNDKHASNIENIYKENL